MQNYLLDLQRELKYRNYSNLSASIGLSFAALYAGKSQNTIQIPSEKQKLKMRELLVITAEIEKLFRRYTTV